MPPPKPYSKVVLDFADDDSAAGVHLPIEPHGVALFVAPDSTSDSEDLIEDVVAVWSKLWPEMRAFLEAEMQGYGVEATLAEDEFIGSLGRMTPDVYMGDKSDIMIRLEFEQPPLWDFFIRGCTIVHSQPVF